MELGWLQKLFSCSWHPVMIVYEFYSSLSKGLWDILATEWHIIILLYLLLAGWELRTCEHANLLDSLDVGSCFLFVGQHGLCLQRVEGGRAPFRTVGRGCEEIQVVTEESGNLRHMIVILCLVSFQQKMFLQRLLLKKKEKRKKKFQVVSSLSRAI